MLSERGMQIVEKLVENNAKPVTSKVLALGLGVSERSVKTYIKEVSDFCDENGMKLERKPGIGFVANFTDEQIAQIEDMKKDKRTVLSKNQRMSYIMFILLSGWDTYTLALFSDELNVSKKVISDDIDCVAERLQKHNITVNRVAGHGVFVTGDEFSIRKALKKYCVFPIGNHKITKPIDYRLSVLDESICVNNFGRDNFERAIQTVEAIEKEYNIVYTDYSFKACVKYLCIQLLRVRMGHLLKENIAECEEYINEEITNKAVEELEKIGKIELNDVEKHYVDIIFASAAMQRAEVEFEQFHNEGFYDLSDKVCDEMLEYMSEILNINFVENDLLVNSLKAFLPASFIRTKYGIEISNPFLYDVKEMYSGIFATTFTLSKFYEKYCHASPTEHEMSFLALYFGGAMHRNQKNVKAILIGTSGVAAASIVAGKIEDKIEEVKIVSILSSEKIAEIDEYEFDIVLSMLPGFEYEDKVVNISPLVSNNDIKKIKDACFEYMTNSIADNYELYSVIDRKYISVVSKKMTKAEILKAASDKLVEDGYFTEDFYSDVMQREEISSTAIGNKTAIPHGKSKNVLKPIVYIIKVNYEIDWGEDNVDIIFLLALNFDNINTTKMFFADLSRFLNSESKIQRIRKSNNEMEIEKSIMSDLHWS